MNAKLLREGGRRFGLELDDGALERFRRYMAELQRWNRSINLTAITQPDEIVCKHFIDSLSIVKLIGAGEHLLDVGSGAGLPGLAVAILRPDIALDSLDAVDKKVRFQRHICRLLGLDQVTVRHGRIEQLSEQNPGHYDVVTSRGFRDLARFIALACPLVRPGGRLVAMVSGAVDETTDDVLQICEQHQLKHHHTEQYSLPKDLGERKLAVFIRNLP